MKNVITSIEGWRYIDAIFHYLMDERASQCETILEPHYIFRGISKRYFTSLKTIEKEKDYNDKYSELKKKLEETDIEENDYNGVLKICPKEIFPEYIRSGSAVRLGEIVNRTYNDYINYQNSLIADVKKKFPSEYQNLTDIEILADLQHKGCATCMVDFSNNFLISLWFAVQEEFEDIGYLFCYDINRDMIESDNLSYLGQKHEERRIKDLLYETTKSSNINGNIIYKFWIWKPSNLNMRIARQDSIFIFGLEPFKIRDHNVIIIPIPHHWKRPILQTLRIYFGITAESVYCDDFGFASANSKLKNYEKMFGSVFSNEYANKKISNLTFDFAPFQNGTSCLLKEQYDIALDFFLEYESVSHNNLSNITNNDNLNVNDIINVELYFSKALCYKYLGQYDAAILEYNKALNKYSKQNIPKNKHLINKLYKILNDCIDLLYEKEDFNQLEHIIDEYVNKFFNTNNELTYFIQTIKNEVALLRMLKMKSYEPLNINIQDTSNPLYNLLNHYFILMVYLGLSGGDKIMDDIQKEYEERIEIVRISSVCKTKWNFKYIESIIDKYYNDDINKKNIFKHETLKIKSVIDIARGKYTIPMY